MNKDSAIDHEKLLLSRSIDSPVDSVQLFYKEIDPEYKRPELYCFVNTFMQWWYNKKEELKEKK